MRELPTAEVIFTGIDPLPGTPDMILMTADDVAVVGFDENDVFNLFYSPITYIKQPIEQIGIEAVNILVDKMKNGELAKKSMVVLEPELIIKTSSLKV